MTKVNCTFEWDWESDRDLAMVSHERTRPRYVAEDAGTDTETLRRREETIARKYSVRETATLVRNKIKQKTKFVDVEGEDRLRHKVGYLSFVALKQLLFMPQIVFSFCAKFKIE